ncbi:TIGR01244 family sulfur transferase [Polynucleobacter sp. MWH-UH25E]|uniref:TIGR01244 family sulfur transferase n=1 Tax=Polynucleobacter sp. MWH-UH25E TaxID=1855616 RepID=UPI001BFDEE7A|nr:TIGR01244 family sulfur transferase [Polynucleobacter sp. MWH-UH25E]QWD63111.1 TIGR01244 family phosphatase [Polynucleobacter sp. MWH-UH25E]
MSLPIACHNDQFGTLGQIEPTHLAEIAKQGYKSVINNRPDGEGGPDQPKNADIQAEAEKLGLNYVYLPVVSGAITPEQVIEMARLLKTLPGPVLAFCRSGARSTNLYQLALQVK